MKSLPPGVKFCFFALLFLEIFCGPDRQATPAITSVLKGAVRDVQGGPITGADVFLYNTPDVRRQADFISPRTGDDGRFRIVVPPGKYWAVARLKKIQGYGPLLPGDKHSGDPQEVELAAGSEAEMDFTVADLKEASHLRKKPREDYVKISGRVIDKTGQPVSHAYVIAHRGKKVLDIPDFISAGTDENGAYLMYIPHGKFFLGAAFIFPPGHGFSLGEAISAEADRSDLDITVQPTSSEKRPDGTLNDFN